MGCAIVAYYGWTLVAMVDAWTTLHPIANFRGAASIANVAIG
jgi:hypothetical protein